MSDDLRQRFEAWYLSAAFDAERDPIGSRDCALQWSAWVAGRAEGFALAKEMHEALRKFCYTEIWSNYGMAKVGNRCLLCGARSMTHDTPPPCTPDCLARPDAIPERKP